MRATWVVVAAALTAACASGPPPTPTPMPDPLPAPEPPATPPEPPRPELPAFALRWKVETREWGGSVAIAPWGDVARVSDDALTLHARETGERIARSTLDGLKCLPGGAAFQADGSLVIVSEEAIDRVTFPARTWERVTTLENPGRALVGQGWVLICKGRALTLHGLPDGERRAELLLEEDPEAVAVSPSGEWLAWSPRGKPGFELRELGGDAFWRLGTKKTGALAFGTSRLLVGNDPWELVAWDLTTRRELPGRYSVGDLRVLQELPDGRPLASGSPNLTLYPPAPEADPAAWRGTQGVSLPLRASLFLQLAVRTDGAEIAGIDGRELTCLALPGPDPSRPYELAELRGVSPPPPGRVLQRPSDEARAAARKAARTEFRELLAGDEPPALPRGGETFLGPEERPAATDAWFVRLASAGLGGEFDLWGDEEVVASVSLDGQSRTLAEAVLDLEDGELLTWEPEDGWLELRAEPARLDLSVYDLDLTGRELVSALVKPVDLVASGFGPEPRRERLRMRRIRSIAEAPWVELEWLRAPRRDARDAESAREVAKAFGRLLELAPNSPPAARALSEWLGPAARDAMSIARHSTHTRLRRALPALASSGRELAHLAAQVGAADPALLQGLRARFAAWFEGRDLSDPPLQASGQAAIAVELRAPLGVEQLDVLIDALLQVQADGELDPRRPLGAFPAPLTELLEAARQARLGAAPGAATRLREGWSTLCEALRKEL